jgi:hypothetical protein
MSRSKSGISDEGEFHLITPSVTNRDVLFFTLKELITLCFCVCGT